MIEINGFLNVSTNIFHYVFGRCYTLTPLRSVLVVVTDLPSFLLASVEYNNYNRNSSIELCAFLSITCTSFHQFQAHSHRQPLQRIFELKFPHLNLDPLCSPRKCLSPFFAIFNILVVLCECMWCNTKMYTSYVCAYICVYLCTCICGYMYIYA